MPRNVSPGTIAPQHINGDMTQAEALRLAKAHLEKMGWKYSAADIGSTARQILDRLNGANSDHNE